MPCYDTPSRLYTLVATCTVLSERFEQNGMTCVSFSVGISPGTGIFISAASG